MVPRKNAQFKRWVVNAYKIGFNFRELSEKYDVPASTVFSWVRRAGALKTNKMPCGRMTAVRINSQKVQRPCINVKGHTGRHTANLIGLQFGNLLVQAWRGANKDGHMQWDVERDGVVWTIRGCSLIHGNCKGVASGPRHGWSKTPEYGSVIGHWKSIFKWCDTRTPTYRGMPFCDNWNPEKNGAYWKGAKWIVDNLGPKPGHGWSIDIIDHSRGFVPGNLRWAQKYVQASNKQHRILGKWTNEEFEVEARKRGYILTKCRLSKKPDNEMLNELPQVAQRLQV